MNITTKVLFLVFIVSFSVNAVAQTAWVAPKSSDIILNPLKNEQNSIKQGKIIFQQLCAICHGDKGKGDGIASAALNPKPANFTKEKFYSQSDGAVYWKLTNGRTPMAPYKEVLSDEKRWQIVNYIKTLKK